MDLLLRHLTMFPYEEENQSVAIPVVVDLLLRLIEKAVAMERQPVAIPVVVDLLLRPNTHT